MKEFGKIYKSTLRTEVAQIFVLCSYEKPEQRNIGFFSGVIVYNTQQKISPEDFDKDESAGMLINNLSDKYFVESSFDELIKHISRVNNAKIK